MYPMLLNSADSVHSSLTSDVLSGNGTDMYTSTQLQCIGGENWVWVMPACIGQRSQRWFGDKKINLTQ